MRSQGSPEIFIAYASGIIVTVRPASEGQATRSYAAAQVADGVPGHVVDVAGVAMFEVPQSSDRDLGSIRMVYDDTIVTIIGQGDFPPSVLRNVAGSVLAYAPAVRRERSA
jgi:hypothetical protein